MTLSSAGIAPAGVPDGDARTERVVTIPFSTVYQEHAPAVYRFCLAQVGDVAVAEDLTAEAFSRACAAYERTEPDPEGVRRWLFAIARNAAHDHRRRQRRWSRLLVGAYDGPHPAAVDVETVVGLRDELRRALLAVKDLGERDRVLVGLRIGGGLSYAEIGEVVGIAENAARTATHRALTRVRAAVEAGQ